MLEYVQQRDAETCEHARDRAFLSRGTFTLSRIEDILRVLELDLVEVARMTRSPGDSYNFV